MWGIIIAAGIGLIIGSFLNVVILRLHTGRSTSGRSGCMNCGTALHWYDLFPVISFLFLQGKCRACGSAISHQYWIVELSTAFLFVLVYLMHAPILIGILLLIMMAVLVVMAVYDIRHTILPNSTVYLFIAIAFIIQLVSLFNTSITFIQFIQYGMAVLISGAVVTVPLFLLWFISKGRWMGFGDVKLSFGFGILLGTYQGFMALFIGFLLGAIVGTGLMYIPKVIKWCSLSDYHNSLTMKSEIPFAPFLIGGLLLVLFFNVDIVSLMGMFM